MLLLLAACERAGAPARDRSLPLGEDTIQLDPSIELVEARVGGSQAEQHFSPAALTARPGDVVRFTTADALTHAIAFDAASLSAESRGFLERTQQLRGPPLIALGNSWVLNLQDAPPGTYRFSCLPHAAEGTLTIAAVP